MNRQISNCKTCNDLIIHKEIKVDNKTYRKNAFIFYNNESKTNVFCSILCKMGEK